MKKFNASRFINQYTVAGILAGLALVLFVVIVDLFINGYSISFEDALELHEKDKILFIIDIIPFVSGFFAYMIAKRIALARVNADSIIDNEHSKTKKIFDFVELLRLSEVEASYSLDGVDDDLSNSLVNLREELKANREEENLRKQEDAQRSWVTEGLAKFSEILRQSKGIEELSNDILKELVRYIDAQQGGFFVVHEDEDELKYFELTAMFAYDRKKFASKKTAWGEGLVGACALEKQTIFVTDVPEGYVNITSGLGRSNPRSILVVPLKVNEEIHGALEFASFHVYQPYQIEFVEKVAESIASTLSNVQINMQTAKLLKESQKQAEIMAQQEEVMRKNMTELKRTQEEAAKQAEQFVNFTNSVNHTLIRAEYNIDGTLMYANTKFLDLLNYDSNSEVENKHISMFINKKDRDWFNQIWRNLAAGGRHFEGDMKHVTRDKVDVWTMATYVSVRNAKGEPEKILFLGIDTTEAKRQSLDYEGQISALNRATLKAEFTPEGEIITCNDRFLLTLGYEMSELENQSVYKFIDPKEIHNFKQVWKNVIDRISFEGQLKNITKEGVDRWFHGTYTAVDDMYGDVAKIIYVANDITEQKRMEIKARQQTEQLRKQEKQLQQSQVELSRKLKETREEMKLQFREIEIVKELHEKTLEGMLDAIVTINSDNIIEFFNKAAEEIWGFTKEDVLGKHIEVLLPSDVDDSENIYMGNYFKHGDTTLTNTRTELFILNHTGEQVSVLVTLSEAKVDDNYSLTAFMQNIEVELF